ncbi:MAG: CHAT domain-containing protein [Cyanobacteria bacterium P01_F01_bin.153]
MRIWTGAIALGLLLSLPAGAIVPQDITGELTADDPSLGPDGYADSYQFEGRAGEAIAIELRSNDFDGLVTLFHSSGPVDQDDDSGGLTDALLVVKLPRDGEYEVVVTSAVPWLKGQYRLAWREATRQDQQRFTAARLNRQGYELQQRGRLSEAQNSFQEAYRLYQAAGDRREEGTTMVRLGELHRRQGQLNQGLTFFRTALDIQRDIGDRLGEAISLNNIGLIHGDQGRYRDAVESYEGALTIFRQLNVHDGEGIALNNLAWVYGALGQYTEATQRYEASLKLRREVGDSLGTGITLMNIGSIEQFQGNYAEAMGKFVAARDIFRTLKDRENEATSLNNIGFLHRTQGRYVQALKQYEAALPLYREIGDRPGEGVSLMNMGDIYRINESFDRALGHYKMALTIFQQAGDRQGAGIILNKIGLVNALQGNDTAAERLFQNSLQLLEAIERDLPVSDQARISFFELRAQTYSYLQATLVAQGKTNDALEVSDRSRARSLAQFLNPTGNSADEAAFDIDQIRQLARDRNATIVSYSIMLEGLYVWVISPERKVAFRKVNSDTVGIPFKAIEAQIRRSASEPFDVSGFFAQERFRLDLQSLRGGEESTWRGGPKDLRRAYDALIKPIADLLPTGDNEHLIIAPHRELSTVPFAALIDESDRFLLDRYAITITPSLQILNAVQAPSPPATGQPLIVGNPAPMPNDLSALPGSEKEAQAIAQALGTEPLIGEQATEATVKQRIVDASVLHFATHGVVANGDRDIAGNWLALADDSGDREDGKLTLTEIFDSNLKAQLAVLSACNTVSGEVTGEGVLGLARAFLKAGVPAVVASLWQVPDEQTQILMEAFYKELLAGKTYAESLRSAQLTVRAQATNPNNWAAFVIIGEGDRTLELP